MARWGGRKIPNARQRFGTQSKYQQPPVQAEKSEMKKPEETEQAKQSVARNNIVTCPGCGSKFHPGNQCPLCND